MTVPVPAGSHPVSAIVTAPGRAIIAAQVSLASGRANMGNVTGTLPVANGGTGATNASDARANLGIFPMTTAQVDAVMDDDEEVVSDNVVNGTVFTYIWGKVKAWAAAAFAPLSHTHTQSQISDMPISVANGGTGSTTASDARTSLGVTPANIGAAPATHDHSGQAITPASVAATGAVSGSSVSDSVGSLASLRESVSYGELAFDSLNTAGGRIKFTWETVDGYTCLRVFIVASTSSAEVLRFRVTGFPNIYS